MTEPSLASQHPMTTDTKQLLLNPGAFVALESAGVPLIAGQLSTHRSCTATVAHFRGGSFSRATGAGRAHSKGKSLRVIQEADVARINHEIEVRTRQAAEARWAEEDRRVRAAYDALPESRKLARSLKWLCDCESEAKIAGAPIDAMRAIIKWADDNNLTTK